MVGILKRGVTCYSWSVRPTTCLGGARCPESAIVAPAYDRRDLEPVRMPGARQDPDGSAGAWSVRPEISPFFVPSVIQAV